MAEIKVQTEPLDLEAFDKVLEDIFETYNATQSVPKYQKNPYILQLEEGGNIIGGLKGYSTWNWFYIDHIGVANQYRGAGHAIEMVRRAEKEAKSRKCIGVWLHTMSFQAPEFYQKLGYEVFGVMEKCAGTHERIFMKKILN